MKTYQVKAMLVPEDAMVIKEITCASMEGAARMAIKEAYGPYRSDTPFVSSTHENGTLFIFGAQVFACIVKEKPNAG